MAGFRESKSSRRNLTTLQKQRKALELRLAGWSLQEIGEHHEIRLSYAKTAKLLNSAMETVILEPAEQVLKLELSRLDKMLKMLWPLMEQGSQNAVDRILKLMERRANLLGLDAPKNQKAAEAQLETVLKELVVEIPAGMSSDDATILAADRMIQEFPAE